MTNARSVNAILVIAASILLLGIPFHLRPDNFVVDDGYFYPEIARYIVHGQGSTFNGMMPTNGYHPLWMMVCVAAAYLTSASSPLLQLLAYIQDALILFSLAALTLIAHEARKYGAFLGSVSLLFFTMVLGIWRLLEANLALALQVGSLLLAIPVLPEVHRRLGKARVPVLGVLLGLTVLARLDLVFFAATLFIYQVFQQEAGLTLASRFGKVVIEVAIAAALIAPYLAWNYHLFHHLLPISGAIKSTFPHVQTWRIGTFFYPVIGAMVLNGMLFFRRHVSPFDRMCSVTAVAAFLHMAYTLSFGELAPWYLTTGYLTVALCIIWLADLVLRRLPRPGIVEIGASALVCLLFLSIGTLRLFSNLTYTRLLRGDVSFHGSYVEPKRALAEKLRTTLPRGSRVFVFDAPGGVAFYSGLSILPADGLVADYAYNGDVVRQGFAAYAAAKHIDYFIAPYLRPGQVYDRLSLRGMRAGGGQTMEVFAPLTRASAGTVTLRDADLVFFARDTNPDLETLYPQVGVWRIEH